MRCIYEQGLGNDEFELICVDDLSPDNTWEILTRLVQGRENMRVVRNEVNLCTGGARNRGRDMAVGQYVVNADCDDLYVDGGLRKLVDFIKGMEGKPCDVIMFDMESIKPGGKRVCPCYGRNSTEMMSGVDFLLTQAVSMTVWLYAFRRDFIRQIGVRSREHAIFEDSDYVLKCLAGAESVVYLPEAVYRYYEDCRPDQGSKSDSTKKLQELSVMWHEVAALGKEAYEAGDSRKAEALLGYSSYFYAMNLCQYAWRVPSAARLEALERSPAYFAGKKTRWFHWVAWSSHIMGPRAVSFMVSCAVPLFKLVAAWLYARRRAGA